MSAVNIDVVRSELQGWARLRRDVQQKADENNKRAEQLQHQLRETRSEHDQQLEQIAQIMMHEQALSECISRAENHGGRDQATR